MSTRRSPLEPAIKRTPDVTRQALLDAAREAFETDGYEGTDTNRIAKAAGFSPQTFYRHFEDKRAIFIETYARWVDGTFGDGAGATSASDAATALLRHHRASRIFRRSLRALSVTDATVRAARTRERLRQIEALRRLFPRVRKRPLEEVVGALLAVERFADAIADEETDDLGVSPRAAKRQLVALVERLVGASGADATE